MGSNSIDFLPLTEYAAILQVPEGWDGSIAKVCAARQPQHVIQRGNNREAIFGAAADYRFYLEKLQAAANKHRCEIHAYVLMTNHVHLLLTPHTEDECSVDFYSWAVETWHANRLGRMDGARKPDNHP